ncbi:MULTISPECIES: NAD-dependent DNA ligase LigA [Prevotella]|nr:NAD-dependent DNA ligase LigA [Prevotella illustrans]
MENKIQQMEALISQLNEASEYYYSGKGELMTDYEWDAAFDKLKLLEEETGEVLPDSPTNKVSEAAIFGQKEEHEYAALSLAKTKSTADITKWADGKPIWLSWKLDGLTLVVTYDKGKLSKVVTRGNGHVGTNITHLAASIKGIPPTIKDLRHVVVRGECVISYADFDRYLLESGEDYANPRNLASGSLTLKNPDEVKQRHLQWIPFSLVYTEQAINSWGERMNWIQQNGMTPVERECIANPTQNNIEMSIAHWTEKVTTMKNPFPVDGLVITYDDYAYSQTGSVTGHHAARAGYAFKWQDEAASTTLDHIEWSCAASTISPVAVFNPVNLEGTIVKRASLCNISECERLGIGGKDTELKVIKANKIIPKVIQVEKKVGLLVIPDSCPVCAAPTVVRTSEASGTKTLHCTNDHCPAKQLKMFARFVSKDGMDIDGVSEQTIARFINLGWIIHYSDIFGLHSHAQEIAALEGFGTKSASNILQSIDKAKKVEARHLLYALTIPMCGQDVCNRLMSAYGFDEFTEQAATTDNEEHFAGIDGIGPEKSRSLVNWFHQPDNAEEVKRLKDILHIVEPDIQPQGNRCAGLTFVVTGDVFHYKNRNELKEYIQSQGGKVTGSVSKSTNYLINNDLESTSGKNQKAHSLGTPIISEEQFIDLFVN